MDDFSPEGEGVIDFTSRGLSENKRVQKQGRGVVEKKTASVPGKILRVAAAGTGLGLALHAAGDKVIDVKAEIGNDRSRSSVNLVLPEESTKNPMPEGFELESPEKHQENATLFDTVFHDLTPEQYQQARAWVDDFKEKIKAKPGYEMEHRQIPQKYKEIIQQTAEVYGLPVQMLYGIIAIENGGGENITNQISGARGVAQLMVETAQQYGLIVNGEVDQRTDPVLSIDVAGRYLRDHMALLGNDVGLTIWSYHAGIGNVYNALDAYSKDKYGEGIGSYGDAIVNNDSQAREEIEAKAKELIEKDKLDYFKLSSNPAVAEVIGRLDDFTGDYVRGVISLNQLENERSDQEFDLGDSLKVSVPANTFPGR